MARVLCPGCGEFVGEAVPVDMSTNFGNGLQLHTRGDEVEFRVRPDAEGRLPGLEWTAGITRQDLAAFLGVRLQP
jgi:hypothetical protein